MMKNRQANAKRSIVRKGMVFLYRGSDGAQYGSLRRS